MYLNMLSALGWIKKNFQDDEGDLSTVQLFEESSEGFSVIDLVPIRGSAKFYWSAVSQSDVDWPGTYLSYYNTSNVVSPRLFEMVRIRQ